MYMRSFLFHLLNVHIAIYIAITSWTLSFRMLLSLALEGEQPLGYCCPKKIVAIRCKKDCKYYNSE